MEKLLHERLREWGSAAFAVNNARSYYGEDDGRVNSMGRVFKKMADEIERYYIPRPRFEDGEPVQFGDEAQVRDDLGEVCKMVFTAGGCEEVMIGFEYDSSASHYMVVDGEFVKRPAPKVLDADGAPTKNGDRVYPINKRVYSDADGYFVDHIEVDDGIDYPRVYFIDDVGMSWMKASELTHERPVFDADGERIKVGDTVYLGHRPTPYDVIEVKDGKIAATSPAGERNLFTQPGLLAHREPDSLEKLRDDILDHGNTKSKEYWADRLTALIERGA